MTRAEAEKLFNDMIWNSSDNAHTGQRWVDLFIELGILKLDDPILCKEDADWDWWLKQPSEVKSHAIKMLRGMLK